MISKIMIVSPAMARQWLKLINHNFNRKLKHALVHQLATDIRAGRWRPNGESIVFDKNGRLIDGQHRLHAIVEADLAVELVVVEGVEPDAIVTIDSTPCRTPAEVLRMKGEACPGHLAKTVVFVWRYEQRRHPFAGGTPTRQEQIATLDRCPRIRDSVAIAAAHATRILPTSLVAFAHFVLAKDDRRDEAPATRFVELLTEGDGLEQTSPIFQLRRRLIEGRGLARQLDQPELVHLIFQAWNGWRSGNGQRLALPSHEGALPRLPAVA